MKEEVKAQILNRLSAAESALKVLQDDIVRFRKAGLAKEADAASAKYSTLSAQVAQMKAAFSS